MSDPTSYASRVPPKVLRGHVIMGALQITIGCAVMVLSIISLSSITDENVVAIGSGIWTGPFFIIAGVAGVMGGKGVKCCTLGCLITCLVFSIIASCLGLLALILESVVVAMNRDTFGASSYSASYDGGYGRNKGGNNDGSKVGSYFTTYYIVYVTGIICTLLFAFEFVLSIVHAVYACRASCCCVPKAAGQLPQQHHQQTVLPDQQVVFVVYPGQDAASHQHQLHQVCMDSSTGQQVPYVIGYESQLPANPEWQPPSYEVEDSGLKYSLP